MAVNGNKEVEVLDRLEKIQNLPTLPVVIQKLREVITDPQSDAEAVSSVIEDDPAIMARVLKLVNSAFYASSEPVKSLQAAVSRIGLKGINNIAISTAVFDTFRPDDEGDFDRMEFWKHCICTGIASTVLYNEISDRFTHVFSSDLLHLSGLLHDIGKIIFEGFFHEEFMNAVRVSDEEDIPLYQAERKVIGVDHAFVGGWLAEKWNLTPDLVQIIRWHHDVMKVSSENKELIYICHAANYLCNIDNLGNGGDSFAPEVENFSWKQMGLRYQDLPELVERIRTESANSAVLLAFLSE